MIDPDKRLAEALAAKEWEKQRAFELARELVEVRAEKERAERETVCWRTEFRERHAEKERAEAERDEAWKAQEDGERINRRLNESLDRLTSALAGARRELHDVLDNVDRALSLPTTEPAKAEEERDEA